MIKAKPMLVYCMSIRVKIASPVLVGPTSGGVVSNYPIAGGEWQCGALSGDVMPGGADFYTDLGNGVGKMDARYSLISHSGVVINIHNTGILKMTPAGYAAEQAGIWPIAPEEYSCYCQPVFQCGDPVYRWLEETVWIGEVNYPDAGTVEIELYAPVKPAPRPVKGKTENRLAS